MCWYSAYVFYLDIIPYQLVGDTKAALLQVFDTNHRAKNGYACTVEPNHRKVFSNLDFKKVLVNNFSNTSVNLCTETGGLFLSLDGKNCSDSQSSNVYFFLNMDSYYHNQANLPHFSGHYGQRSSGFGALASGIGRVALSLARKIVIPPAKKIGKGLLLQAGPELIHFATKRKSPKQALKSTVRKTIKKQVGGGSRTRKTHPRKRTTVVKRKTRRVIPRNRTAQRSRSDFFTRVKNDF